jgi:hypothetical protein
MAHPAQRQFFEKVKAKFPENFKSVSALDFGSLDINGTLKDLFEYSDYKGIDIHAGPNVDIVSAADKLNRAENGLNLVDTIVSGEMLEHDEFWFQSLMNMYAMLKDGGLMAISAAGSTRPEHGTKRTTGDGNLWGTSPDYYNNMCKGKFGEFIDAINSKKPFKDLYLEDNGLDIYFYAIK